MTEGIMQDIIRDEFTGRTLISVAHRLCRVLDFDLVVMVMDNGVVAELGCPAELLKLPDSAFRELCKNSGEGIV